MSGVIQRLDDGGKEVLATVRTGYSDPADMLVDGEALWIGINDPLEGHVLKVDTARDTIIVDIPVDGQVRSLTMGEGAIWVVVAGDPGGVVRVDPSTNEVQTGYAPGTWAAGADHGHLWVPAEVTAGTEEVAVRRIDPHTAEPVGEDIILGLTTFLPLGSDEEGIWFIGGDGAPTIARLNAATERVDHEVMVGSSHDLDAETDQTAGVVWVADGVSGEVTRIDLESGTRR